jgi:hypothetical protein
MPAAEARALLDRDEERALHGVFGVGAVATQPQRDAQQLAGRRVEDAAERVGIRGAAEQGEVAVEIGSAVVHREADDPEALAMLHGCAHRLRRPGWSGCGSSRA